jgi:hypothetical protein
LRIVLSWLVTAKPINPLPANVAVPSDDQLVPSVDTDAVTVDPERVSFNHGGDVTVALARNVVFAPPALRVMNSMMPPGLTSRITSGADGPTVCRIITPAFAYGEGSCSYCTRAMMLPSAASRCETNWNASVVPQMSEPAPATSKTLLPHDDTPLTPTAPTSVAVHGAGSGPVKP